MSKILKKTDRLAKIYYRSAWLVLLLLVSLLQISVSNASTCRGRFVNPVTDVCWSCLMPISIGNLNIGDGMEPRKRDTKNPSSPVCLCTKSNIPIPGLSIGFWEPVRLVDITRTPYCMTNLGGMTMGADYRKIANHKSGSNVHDSKYSFYHLHYYVYPLIYWLELITDFICLEESSFDIAYMSEFDPTWNDPKLQSILNPEALLFANPIAQSICALDCASSTVATPIDSLFWCAGCLGNIYPFSGANADHSGGVQTSSLLTARIIAKMHRTGFAKETSTSDGRMNGPLCRKSMAMKIKKSQYKLQMTYPRPSSGPIGCWPIGLSDVMYSSFNEYPNDGEDWGYLIWRKINCCMF